MTGPIDDNLFQQVIGTLVPLCIGAAVLTGIYQFFLWILRSMRRRWTQQQYDRQHYRSV